jgi:hypothetical protein
LRGDQCDGYDHGHGDQHHDEDLEHAGRKRVPKWCAGGLLPPRPVPSDIAGVRSDVVGRDDQVRLVEIGEQLGRHADLCSPGCSVDSAAGSAADSAAESAADALIDATADVINHANAEKGARRHRWSRGPSFEPAPPCPAYRQHALLSAPPTAT